MEISTGRLSPPSQVCPHIPKPLEAIILKAMEYSPADRYQSGAAMADDFRRFARGKAISARQPQLADHAVRWLIRNPRRSIASVVAVAAFGLLIVIMMYAHSRSLKVVNSQLAQLNRSFGDTNRELANAYTSWDRAAIGYATICMSSTLPLRTKPMHFATWMRWDSCSHDTVPRVDAIEQRGGCGYARLRMATTEQPLPAA